MKNIRIIYNNHKTNLHWKQNRNWLWVEYEFSEKNLSKNKPRTYNFEKSTRFIQNNSVYKHGWWDIGLIYFEKTMEIKSILVSLGQKDTMLLKNMCTKLMSWNLPQNKAETMFELNFEGQ